MALAATIRAKLVDCFLAPSCSCVPRADLHCAPRVSDRHASSSLSPTAAWVALRLHPQWVQRVFCRIQNNSIGWILAYLSETLIATCEFISPTVCALHWVFWGSRGLQLIFYFVMKCSHTSTCQPFLTTPQEILGKYWDGFIGPVRVQI